MAGPRGYPVIGRMLLCLALICATPLPAQASELELRQPSPELETAMAGGDPSAALDLAVAEIEACTANAGAEPTVEMLAPCAVLIMLGAQLAQQAGMAQKALDFGQAGADLARAMYGEHSDIEAYARLARGQALLQLSRNEKALAELESALGSARILFAAGASDLTPFLGGLADARLANRQPASARALLEEAIPIETDDLSRAQLRLQHAVALIGLEELDASLVEARTAAAAFAELLGETSDKPIEARIRIAGALAALEMADEAIGAAEESARSFIRAIEILKDQEKVNLEWFAIAALNLGRMTELLARPEVALDLADSILKVSALRSEGGEPLQARVRGARASALFELGRYDEAIADSEIAWQIASNRAEMRDLAAGAATIRARAEAARGDAEAARTWFDRASRLAAQAFSDTDANRLAILYLYSAFELETGGDFAAARTLLRRATGGSLARIEGYDDFDAAAQREMRSLALLFRDQVEAAWRLGYGR